MCLVAMETGEYMCLVTMETGEYMCLVAMDIHISHVHVRI